MEAVDYVRKVWLPARGLVAEAIKGRAAVDAGGRIIVLPKVGGAHMQWCGGGSGGAWVHCARVCIALGVHAGMLIVSGSRASTYPG
jgi:hypothetical protein